MVVILMADSEPLSVNVTSFLLEEAGYRVLKTCDGPSTMQTIVQQHPSLVLLDVAMPKLHGFEICRQVRCTSDVPIIFLSAQAHVNECVTGLQIGGDDYLAKPFEPVELLARVEVMLRRCNIGTEYVPPLIRSDITLNPIGRTVLFGDGHIVELTQLEFRLLYYLMKNAGCTLNINQILLHVWGYDHQCDGHSVVSYIRRLRNKIEPDPAHPIHVITVRSLGYKFELQHDALLHQSVRR
jgi:DNA-binding response OmpR family regulator